MNKKYLSMLWKEISEWKPGELDSKPLLDKFLTCYSARVEADGHKNNLPVTEWIEQAGWDDLALEFSEHELMDMFVEERIMDTSYVYLEEGGEPYDDY